MFVRRYNSLRNAACHWSYHFSGRLLTVNFSHIQKEPELQWSHNWLELWAGRQCTYVGQSLMINITKQLQSLSSFVLGSDPLRFLSLAHTLFLVQQLLPYHFVDVEASNTCLQLKLSSKNDFAHVWSTKVTLYHYQIFHGTCHAQKLNPQIITVIQT